MSHEILKNSEFHVTYIVKTTHLLTLFHTHMGGSYPVYGDTYNEEFVFFHSHGGYPKVFIHIQRDIYFFPTNTGVIPSLGSDTSLAAAFSHTHGVILRENHDLSAFLFPKHTKGLSKKAELNQQHC